MLIFKKSALFLAAVFVLFQSSCQSPSKPRHAGEAGNKKEVSLMERETAPRILRINIGGEPRTLDPARARDLKSITLVKMLFEGLTRVNQGEKVEGALAEKIDIADDLRTYTFHLRDSIWTNGDSVTADDFVYAWRRILDPKAIAENAFQLYVIKNAKACKEGKLSLQELKVEAIDEKTLKVELENPTPYFLELTSYPAFFPINAKVDRNQPKWTEAKEDYVCNGPFTLKEWLHHDKLCVQKNEKYWDAQDVQLQEIHLFMIQEEAELAMFENSKLDWAGSPLSTLPVDVLPKLREMKMLHSQPILGTYFLRLNTGSGLLASEKLRRALSFSIDREALVEHVLMGSQVVAQGYVPGALQLLEAPYFAPMSEESLATLAKTFEEGLQETGLQREDLAKVELLYSTSERNQRIAHALQAQWMHLFGVQIKLFGVEHKVYVEKLHKGDFQMAAGSWLADFGDAFSFLEVFKERNSSTNHTHWGDTTYTQLLETSNTTADPVERHALLARCEKILLEAMPIIPLFHYNMLYVQNENVKNIYVSRMGGIDFRWARYVQGEDSGHVAHAEKK